MRASAIIGDVRSTPRDGPAGTGQPAVALRSRRPYRRGWPRERVHDHLRSLSGTHLEPRVVETFLTIVAANSADA